MKTVNAILFKVMHKLNAITKDYLEEAKNTIKENGISCVTFNKNADIQIELADAQAKYSAEDNAKLEALKATFVNLNEGKKIQKIVVKNYSKNEDSIAQDLFNYTIDVICTDKAVSKALANSASKIKRG